MLKGANPTLRLAVVLIVSLGVAAGTWLVQGPEPARAGSVASKLDRDGVVADPPGAVLEAPDAPLVAPDELVDDALAAPEPVGAGRTVAVVESSSVPDLGSDDLREIPGRVVRIDDDARRFEDEDGQLKLRVAGRRRMAVVRGGEWSVHGRPGEMLELERIVVGGLRARLTNGRESVRLPESGEVLLEVELFPAVTVHVVDAETGDPLDAVEVYARGGNGSEDARWYGEPVLDGVDSPLRVGPRPRLLRSTRRLYWVRADGYGWGALSIDFAEDEEATVELAPAGDLELVGLAALAEEHAWLIEVGRTDVEDLAIELRLDPGRDTWRVRSLAPGAWRARLTSLPIEEGMLGYNRRSSDRTLVDIADFEIHAGKTARVRFSNREPAEDASIPLAGTVALTPGARVRDHRIEIRRDSFRWSYRGDPDHVVPGSAFQVTRHDPWSFDWDAGLLEPGRYQVRLVPSLEFFEIDLVAPGRNDLRIESRETAQVDLRVFDKRTNDAWPVVVAECVEPAPVIHLEPGEEPPRLEMTRPRSWTVARESFADPFRFSAPPGQLEWRTGLDGEWPISVTLDVRSGANDFTIVLDRDAETEEEALRVVRNEPGAPR